MYKLSKSPITNIVSVVTNQVENILYSIPFDPANTDYANFKRDIENGAELQDADGNVMSADAAKAFVGTLP